MTIIEMKLEELVNQQILGVSPIVAAHHLEACLICLDHHNHISGTLFEVKGNQKEAFALYWNADVTEQMRRTWRDMQDATEFGATAMAILLILLRTEYTIVERSVKGTGVDYWLLEKSRVQELADDEIINEKTARLEVSGILHAEKDSQIDIRLKEKVNQVSIDATIPVIVIVTEFSRPEGRMVKRYE